MISFVRCVFCSIINQFMIKKSSWLFFVVIVISVFLFLYAYYYKNLSFQVELSSSPNKEFPTHEFTDGAFETKIAPGSSDILYSNDNKEVLNVTDSCEVAINLRFKIKGLQGKNLRHLLIHRYSSNQYPYPGWAVAVKVGNEKFRPQFYYRNSRGQGGWFSFQEVAFNESDEYNLIIGLSHGKYVLGYLVTNSYLGGNFDKKVEFIGGLEITDIVVNSLSSEMIVNHIVAIERDLSIEVKSFLLGCGSFMELSRNDVTNKLLGESSLERALGISKVIAASNNN